MIKSLAELYSLLTDEQRKKLLKLQILVTLMAFAEIVGVVSIGPFMALVGDMSRLQGEGLIADIYRATGAGSPTSFLLWVGVGVLLMLTLAALISMVTIWRLSLYGARVGVELGNRLFKHYMYQPWTFHAAGNTSQLTNKITQECQRITLSVINPLMLMNAKLVMAIFMLMAIFIYNPLVAIVGLVVFIVAYLLLYATVRRRLIANGTAISEAQTQRYKLIIEGFGGIKDALVLGRQRIFTRRFSEASGYFADAQGVNQALSQAPRYAMELVAFGSVIFLVLYLLATYQGNLGSILPVLSVYALAGFKLLPAFQQVYSSVSQIRGALAAFDTLRDDLRASVAGVNEDNDVPVDVGRWVPQHSIAMQDIVFTYPNKQDPALDGLTLEIPANRVIGLVGASGSGKSTTIDMLLGLIKPSTGRLLIDGQPLEKGDMRAWQNTLGFVPQHIFLTDATIRENIAFGLPPESIDDVRVCRAASMAHLDGLLNELPEGIHTRVGERGVQLSGGQRQRIGIARALYSDAEVLVLDEATSALDGITEKLVMDAVHDFSGKKTTIIIAHRLATVKQCDCIYLIDQGRVVDAGRYEELLLRNDIFKRMAAHA
ncbi:ABC transporter ATP-binding protein [Halomonas sp. HP20-15]|uniref:ABC transporter ATP-binding protein n=1 Tax=Halomonas sp. HP20-15 TaxID=3085901 RepID=UPI002981BC60|nr:ABC transporter ATP-binding protein [Halomonas sp. HP20-15]MDW5377014.1 ABC transporter ATP-binding protein [Halomonas sp. HP20-15]